MGYKIITTTLHVLHEQDKWHAFITLYNRVGLYRVQ